MPEPSCPSAPDVSRYATPCTGGLPLDAAFEQASGAVKPFGGGGRSRSNGRSRRSRNGRSRNQSRNGRSRVTARGRGARSRRAIVVRPSRGRSHVRRQGSVPCYMRHRAGL